MGIRDSPYGDKLYSTLGGICGYSVLIIKLLASRSLSDKLNDL